jgi:hypothetical protein
MSSVDLVVIYGPPGVGKLTTARELSRLTGYKLFDNHASIDVIRRVFDFDAPPFWTLVNRLRWDVFEQAVMNDVSLVFTHVYHPDELEAVQRHRKLVEDGGGRVCHTSLRCDIGVLVERLQSEQRAAMGKVTSPEVAARLRANRDLFALIPDRESLIIDNTLLEPDESARRIIEHYRLPLLEGA